MTRTVKLIALALLVSVVWVGAREAPASARRRRRPPPTPHPKASVQFSNTADLSPDRHTANVVLSVTCPAGATPVPIRVTVRQGGTSATAQSGTNYKCTGHAQRVLVPVTAGSAFHKGSAMASAAVTWHSSTKSSGGTSTGTANVNSSAQIQLV